MKKKIAIMLFSLCHLIKAEDLRVLMEGVSCELDKGIPVISIKISPAYQTQNSKLSVFKSRYPKSPLCFDLKDFNEIYVTDAKITKLSKEYDELSSNDVCRKIKYNYIRIRIKNPWKDQYIWGDALESKEVLRTLPYDYCVAPPY